MIISTINGVAGKKVVEHVGYVKGSTIRAKHIGRDFAAGLKQIVGGEIKGYTEMMDESRKIAIGRMVDEAEALGANAIIGFKLQSSAVMAGAAEIIAYGTAVIVE